MPISRFFEKKKKTSSWKRRFIPECYYQLLTTNKCNAVPQLEGLLHIIRIILATG